MADRCRPVTVTGIDGEEITVPVLGDEPLLPEMVDLFGEIVRAAQRYAARQPHRPGWLDGA